jgi:predicted transcriptional regulator of viral defense system
MSQVAGISGRGRGELARVLATGRRFVTPADVAAELGVDAGTAAKRLARWAEQGWVRRVRRGLYIDVPVQATNPATWGEDPLLVAAQVWPGCYFTGWTAASHWALSEQVFRTTVLKTSQRVRAASVRLLDHDYLLAHVAEPALGWGLSTQWQDGVRLRFADPARTVIDSLDTPRLAGGIRHAGDILTAYLAEHDPGALIAHGDRWGNRAVFKRLGFLVETLALEAPGLVAACQERLSTGISWLDPDGPDRGRRVMRWRLHANVTVVGEGAS